jgi:hemolysin III
MFLEEVFNTITHGIGALLSAFGLMILLFLSWESSSMVKIISFSIFGGSLLILYTASTLYHAIQKEKIKHFMKIFDHAAIYVLIAGTYTPFALVMLEGVWSWLIMVLIWSLAAVGVIFKLFFVNRFQKASTIIYLIMGWLIIIAIKPMISSVPFGGLMLLLAGGIAYTAGVVFYVWDRLPFNHAIWHLFVLGGSIAHYLSVFFYVLPQ